MKFELRMDDAWEVINAVDLADAEAQAKAWGEDGDWPFDDEEEIHTFWLDVLILAYDEEKEEATDEELGEVHVQVDPPEPRCVALGVGHDWVSAKVLFGNESSTEVCLDCGCAKEVYYDGLEQANHRDGEGIRYVMRAYAKEVKAFKATRCEIHEYDANLLGADGDFCPNKKAVVIEFIADSDLAQARMTHSDGMYHRIAICEECDSTLRAMYADECDEDPIEKESDTPQIKWVGKGEDK